MARQFQQPGFTRVVYARDAPAPLPKLEGAAVLVEVVAGHRLRAAGARYDEVEPLGDADVDRARGRGRDAVRLAPEPVAIEMPGVHVVGPGHQRAHHNWVSQQRLQDRCLRVAMQGAAEAPRRVADARRQRLHAQVEGAPARSPHPCDRVVVLDQHRQLPEAAAHVGRNLRVGSDVGECAAQDVHPAVRVVVAGAGWLGDQGAEQPVPARRDHVDVVVEEGSSELGVRIPAVADELGADDLADLVRVRQRTVEAGDGPVDRGDATRLELLVAVHADTDHCPDLEAIGAGKPELGGARGRGAGEGLALSAERSNRLLVVEAGVDTVAGLDVELDEVDVRAHLAERVVGVVAQLAPQQYVDTVLAGVGSDGEGHAEPVVGDHGVLLVAAHEQLT